MYGHTHDQYFNVANSYTNPDKPISVAQIGPSVTTDSYKNPGYALIEIDKETMLPLNYQIWAMDLVEANKNNNPTWEMFTDYRKDYGLESMSPDEMKKLAYQI